MAKTSTIISSTIDETFPVAGVDNDSQGFRDNFNIIKDNFTYAKSDFDDLFGKVLLKAPLNGDTDSLSNAMDNETISSVNLKEATHQYNNGVVGNAPRDLSFVDGHYYFIDDVSKDITLTCKDWPDTNQYAEMYIQISGNGGATRDVTFASVNASSTASTVYTDGNAAFGGGAVITLSLTTFESKIIKAWTTNGGTDVYFQFIGTYNAV